MTPPANVPNGPADPLADPAVAAALAEYQAELDAGRRPNRAALLARHPSVAAVLDGCLRAVEFVHGAVHGPAGGVGLGSLVGDFRVVRELGRGGMGVVFEAFQPSLGRRVALKVLPAGFDERALQRFRHEAQAVAALQHPHIVPVFAVGNDAGVHYLAMQYIDGRSLAGVVATLRTGHPEAGDTPGATAALTPAGAEPGAIPVSPGPLPSPFSTTPALSPSYYREVARLVAQVADALHHAHEVGIVHRDVKPANLLLDAKGDVWVADFGLARLPGSDLTDTADVMGTVRYMCPEQASGRAVALDGRADVYSLGVTLYELLTLTPAFEADDRRALLRKVLEEEPVAPRKRARAIPTDLETVCLKAMAKDPTERYPSAAALADDLRRFLDDRPVEAKPPTAVQRGRKWVWRNRMLVGVAAVVGLTGLVATAGVLFASNSAIDAKRRDAVDALGRESLALDAERTARAAERRTSYLHTAALAYREWESGNLTGAAQLLDDCPPEYRRWEWHYLNRLARPDWGAVNLPAGLALNGFGFTPTGEGLVIAGGEGFPLTVGDAVTLAPSRYTLGPATSVACLAPSGTMVFSSPNPSPTGVKAASPFSTYHPVTGREVRRFDGHAAGVVNAAFSPGGRRLLTFGPDRYVKVWDTDTGTLLKDVTGPDFRVRVAAFHPDRPEFAVVTDGAIRLWDWDGRQVRRIIHDDQLRPPAGAAQYTPQSLAFRPDGRTMAVGLSNGTVRVWDVLTGGVRLSIPAHSHHVRAVRFSPDGRRLATAGVSDQVVRLWDADSGRPVAALRGLPHGPDSLQFDPTGRFLMAGSTARPGDLRVWDLTARDEARPLGRAESSIHKAGHNGGVTLTFDPSGRRLLVSCAHGRSLWEPGTGRLIGTADPSAPLVLGAGFTPDDRGVALVTADGRSLWEPAIPRPNERVPPPGATVPWNGRPQPRAKVPTPVPVGQVAFSDDGTRFVAIDWTSAVRLHNSSGVEERRFPTVLGSPTYYVAMSGNGTCVATAGEGGVVTGWDAATGQRRWQVRPFDQSAKVVALSFDRTGRRLAAGLSDGVVAVLGGDDGRILRRIQGVGHPALCLAFSPCGERVVGGFGYRDDPFTGLKVWDAETGLVLFSVPLPTGIVGLAFRSDGGTLAALDDRGQAWLLDGQTDPAAEARRRRWAVWHDLQSADAEAAGQWWATRWHIDRLLAAEPGESTLLARRHRIDPLLGKFAFDDLAPEAVAELADTIPFEPMEPVYHLACRLVIDGNRTAYRRLCERALASLTPATGLFQASLIYRLFGFGPGAADDMAAVARQHDERVKAGNRYTLLYVSAGLLYRAGDYAAAKKSLLETETMYLGAPTHVLAWLYLALVCHKLGEQDRAKEWLTKADELYAREVVGRPPDAKVTLGYQNLLPFLLLRREAAQLMEVR